MSIVYELFNPFWIVAEHLYLPRIYLSESSISSRAILVQPLWGLYHKNCQKTTFFSEKLGLARLDIKRQAIVDFIQQFIGAVRLPNIIVHAKKQGFFLFNDIGR